MSFSILIGGQSPEEKELERKGLTKNNNIMDNEELPMITKARIEGNTLMEKWDFCKFKSPKMEYTVQGCCSRGAETHIGHVCLKLGTQGINPLICSVCNYYERKEENF